jgi:hypothetical protein
MRSFLTAAILSFGLLLTLAAHKAEQRLACHAAQRAQLAYVATAPIACPIR